MAAAGEVEEEIQRDFATVRAGGARPLYKVNPDPLQQVDGWLVPRRDVRDACTLGGGADQAGFRRRKESRGARSKARSADLSSSGRMNEAAPCSDDNLQGQLPLRVGCTFGLDAVQPTTTIMQVAPRPEAGVCIEAERWDTNAYHHTYVDHYGNRCERFGLDPGHNRVCYEARVMLPRSVDVIESNAPETPVELLPDDAFTYVMPSRFCLPDELGHEAWQRFGGLTPGWGRVQAIVDYVHGYLDWVPGASNPWTTAADAYRAGQGVCRDFAHLAITFCRALNIPARYVFGYIPDINVPPPSEPMDFAAWFEAYLDGQWHTFDARNNRVRVGRVVVGRGRDAVDVALITSFGALTLTDFEVKADRLARPVPE